MLRNASLGERRSTLFHDFSASVTSSLQPRFCRLCGGESAEGPALATQIRNSCLDAKPSELVAPGVVMDVVISPPPQPQPPPKQPLFNSAKAQNSL